MCDYALHWLVNSECSSGFVTLYDSCSELTVASRKWGCFGKGEVIGKWAVSTGRFLRYTGSIDSVFIRCGCRVISCSSALSWTALMMLRFVLRLRPSARLPCPRVLPGASAALGSRSLSRTCGLRRLHCGATVRTVSWGHSLSHRGVLRSTVAPGHGQSRCYSLPPHQKVCPTVECLRAVRAASCMTGRLHNSVPDLSELLAWPGDCTTVSETCQSC